MKSVPKEYIFVPMTEEYAQEIAYKWKYRGKYSFYNITKDTDDLEEFVKPESWDSTYFAVLDEEEQLIGFYSYNFENGLMWIGLGLKPKYTGKGLGANFIQAGIDFGINEFQYTESKILLSVAAFNKRAMKVYEKLGFLFIERVEQESNGKVYPFIRMGKSLKNNTNSS